MRKSRLPRPTRSDQYTAGPLDVSRMAAAMTSIGSPRTAMPITAAPVSMIRLITVATRASQLSRGAHRGDRVTPPAGEISARHESQLLADQPAVDARVFRVLLDHGARQWRPRTRHARQALDDRGADPDGRQRHIPAGRTAAQRL